MIVHLKNLDWIMIGSAVLLTIFGITSIYSVSVGYQNFFNFQKQLIFFGIGLFFMFLVSFVDWRWIKNNPYLILMLYGIGVLAIAGLFIFAPEIRGTKGWYKIGGISVDPIEFMKVILIILMAKYFSMRHIEMYRIRHILLSGIYFALPIALIFFKPDLGSAILLSIIWLVTLIVSGIKKRHLFVILCVGLLIFASGWSFVLQDYQKDRILSFVEPELDPLGIGWSQLQSKIAVGNGGIFGTGFQQGSQTMYGFLSEPQTDFIFASLAEQFGFVGIVFLFLLFGILILRVLKMSREAQSNFPRLVGAGFATILIMEIGINVGMNLGLLPIVGLPLPFVSYGGSSLIMGYIGLGILQSIKTHS